MTGRTLSLLFAICIVGYAQQTPQLRLQEVQEIQPTSYRAELTLDPAKTDFSGSIEIVIDIGRATQTIWLNASEIDVQSAVLEQGGKTLNATAKPVNDFLSLAFPSSIETGPATLRIKYTGKVRSPQPQGIFSGEDNGNKYLFTQFEATDARDAFPCFDEPSYKTPWQLTLHIPAGQKAVSNTPIASERTEGATDTIQFEQTKPLPSYLIAFAVGPLEFVPAGTAGENHIPVRIVVPKGRAEEAKFAASVTAKFIDRLEKYFGIPYPYPKCDQVALLKADFGAMENAGMVTYEPSVLLAKPSEDTVVRQREYVLVAFHELAHQWFGDLVTLQWWNEVWLNEAFASWMEQKMRAEWNPEWNHAEDVVALEDAESVDTLSAARKIRQEIKSAGDIDNAFDAITYDKGAAVIGMFEHWIGPEVFRAGIHNYLEKYAYKTANTDELMAELDQVAHRDVKGPFSTFTNQPGIPIVQVEEKCSGSSATLQLEQHRLVSLGSKGATDDSWQIPFCVRAGSGSESQVACHLITQRSESWALPGKTCPQWLDGNADAEGYYRVQYAKELLPHLTSGDAQKGLNAAERADLMSNATAEATTARLPFDEALALVQKFASDPDPSVLEAALELALSIRGTSLQNRGVRGDLLDASLIPQFQQFLTSTFGQRAHELGWSPKPGESYDVIMARRNLLPDYTIFTNDSELASQAKELASGWLEGKWKGGETPVRGLLVTYAAVGTAADAELLRKLSESTTDLQRRDDITSALRYFRDPDAVKANLDAFLSHKLRDETGRTLFLKLPTPQTQQIPFHFVEDHFDALVKVLPFFTRSEVPAVGSSFCDETSRQSLNNFFASRVQQIPGSQRVLNQTLERIDGCIALKAAQHQNIEAFFSRQ